ncbi:anthranilate phosphoribosyltransferase [Alicyclobacillus ferrooxydans]|uniref:Anthranilate phosphoribosyltransferase n=1 Tax=Alicyclobacillus ferrooxydans TaxID=471514 RepID=A0A0P9D646_9BACL|nr:anthranilate phosphoribosyltransferase [Alicyclobacillus ferrooxydans]KPV44875.1 anthranilate phosphoribosyltransferase [Alicyclobacillus ferrooxydans]
MQSFVSDVLHQVSRGETLSVETAESFMNRLMAGEISAVQTAGLLAAMAVRGESVEEIIGFARAMRANSLRVDTGLDVVDTCGTGGDGANTFNISTAAALVASAVSVPIAKHGNRAVSSKSGSADILSALGARIDLDDMEAVACLNQTNLCFLFAQTFHPAMKHAAEPRKQLGFRTIFNILGPLTNPAGATKQVLGVYRPELVDKVAEALGALGTKHALVVHGSGGIDELSIQGATKIAEVRDGQVRITEITPEDVGLRRAPISEVVGGNAEQNAQILREVFAGSPGPKRDIVLLNAGAVLYVGGKAESIREGVALSGQAIDSGRVLRQLDSFVRTTHAVHHEEAEVAQ